MVPDVQIELVSCRIIPNTFDTCTALRLEAPLSPDTPRILTIRLGDKTVY